MNRAETAGRCKGTVRRAVLAGTAEALATISSLVKGMYTCRPDQQGSNVTYDDTKGTVEDARARTAEETGDVNSSVARALAISPRPAGVALSDAQVLLTSILSIALQSIQVNSKVLEITYT